MIEENYDTGYSTASGFRGIKAQGPLDNRYLNEDVGNTMVLFTELARAVGVPTPTIDVAIQIPTRLVWPSCSNERYCGCTAVEHEHQAGESPDSLCSPGQIQEGRNVALISHSGPMLVATAGSDTPQHELRAYRSGIKMPHGTSTTKDAESVGLSPLRLRVGVALIILWLLPFWALGPHIAHSLTGLSNPPSAAAVTTAIVVVQTIIGLLGLWLAGTEVKSIVKGSTLKRSLSALWSVFIHGEIPGHETVGDDPSDDQPPLKSA